MLLGDSGVLQAKKNRTTNTIFGLVVRFWQRRSIAAQDLVDLHGQMGGKIAHKITGLYYTVSGQ